jgi:hypothetical protein
MLQLNLGQLNPANDLLNSFFSIKKRRKPKFNEKKI